MVEEQRSQEQAQEKLVLRLQPKRSIKWDASVVDNEHMNKKSSKRKQRMARGKWTTS